MPPLVSVIIPCHNASGYVCDAINSALMQTYPNVEVIVVDDGSTDESVSVLERFAGSIYWETGPARGGGAARNRGLAVASGEFIQFLDADDLLHSDKLEKQVPLALRCTHAIPYSDYFYCLWGAEHQKTLRAATATSNDSVTLIAQNSKLQTSAPLHRRGALNDVGGFNPKLRGSQEIDLHLRLAILGYTFHRLPEALYTVRARPDSVSSNYVRTVSEQLKFMPDVIRKLKESGGWSEARAIAIATMLARRGRACMQRGSSEVAMEFFRLARESHVSGGMPGAYDTVARVLLPWLGPRHIERVVAWKRSFLHRN